MNPSSLPDGSGTATADPLLAPMPLRSLGRTGWRSSVLTLGGVKWDALCSESEAIRLIQRAFELGVNTFDTAHGYGAGESERRLGLALAGIRDRVFVSTKTDDRTYDGARRQMDASLARLQVDQVDLMFIHGLDDAADCAAVLKGDGVVRAIREYRDAGRIRFIGVSGHWYRASMERMLRECPLDAVLCPVGLFNLAYGYDYVDTVIPLARERGMAVMGMKVFGAGRVKHAASIEPYLRYSQNLDLDSMVIGCESIRQLEQMIGIIKSDPQPLPAPEQQALFEECRRITQSWDAGEFNWVSHYVARPGSAT